MDDEDIASLIATIMGIIFGVLIFYFMYSITISKTEIVEKGAAYYHSQTGEFTWCANIHGDKE